MDDLICISEQDSFLSPLPLLDVHQLVKVCVLTRGSILLSKSEFKRLELLITIEITFKVLQKDNFFVDRLRVVEKVEVRDLISYALRRLAVAIESGLLLGSLDVVEVELVGVQDDLGAVVEEHTV